MKEIMKEGRKEERKRMCGSEGNKEGRKNEIKKGLERVNGNKERI